MALLQLFEQAGAETQGDALLGCLGESLFGYRDAKQSGRICCFWMFLDSISCGC